MPATFVVNTTTDTGTGVGLVGDLRYCITQTNALAGLDEIDFAIPGTGVKTIVVSAGTPLPAVTEAVTIDGYTQAGASPNTLPNGIDAVLTIQLDGGYAVDGGLVLSNTVGSLVRGLAVTRFGGAGIFIDGGRNNVIAGSFLGPDTTGMTGVLNNGGNDRGVIVAGGSTGNIIGGTLPAARNLISGNNAIGVELQGVGTTGNVVAGNFIGVDRTGAALGNLAGVRVRARASGNTIGGAGGAANVISGNAGDGVLVSGVSGTLVVGNYIGTDETGQFDLGNRGNGVVVTAGALRNTIGGSPRNVISGNVANGVIIADGATLTTVDGNIIGLAADGVKRLGNTLEGVFVRNADRNLIGHADPVTGVSYFDSNSVPTQPVSLWQGIRNSDAPNRYLISGTSGDNGLLFDGTIAGVGASFLVNYPNAATTSVYGPDNSAGNEVRLVGVYKNADAATAAVKVNGFLFEGTTADLSNPANYRTVNQPGAEFNYVHSTMNGLAVGNYDSQPDHGMGGLLLGPGHAYIYDIAQNKFLTDIVFPGSKSNTAYGIWYNGGTSYTICGGYSLDAVNNLNDPNRPIGQGYLVDYDSATGKFTNFTSFSYPFGTNVVTHFEGISSVEKGVYTLNADSVQAGTSNPVQGSFVTVRRNTDGSFGPGVWVNLNDTSVPSPSVTSSNSVYGNQVVGVVFSAGGVVSYQATVNVAFQLSNVIAGNGGNGVTLDAANDNAVAMNFIGTDRTGTLDRGNNGNGILVTNGSAGNMIGGEATGANDPTAGVFVRPPQGNLISGNDANGVLITGNATRNQLSGNFIGTAASGNSALGNAGDGVAIVGADGNSLLGCTFQQDPFVFYNVISGNGGNGLRVTDSDDTTIQANFFGIGADNDTAVGNALNGVLVNGNSARTTMGGPIPLGNVDAANGMNGIHVADTASAFISYNTFAGLAAFSDNPTLGNKLDGMLITSTGGNILIRTNVISRNGDDGIEISGNATDVRVAGNIIGLNTQGQIPFGNIGNGVEVGGNAHGIVIGGPQPTFNVIPRNVVSSNGGNGVAVLGNANNVTISDGYIGTDLMGKQARGNKNAGVFIGSGTSSITVGSPDPNLLTVVSGNAGNGIELQGTSGNTVVGSLIGVAADGTTPMGNGGAGIFIASSFGNVIGGTTATAANRIAFNAGAGVVVGSSPADVTAVGDRVLGNSIYSNVGLGIDLGNNGVTPNGANPRPFPNRGQNYPVLTATGTNGTTATVVGTFQSIPTATFRVEFFANPPGGNQAQTFIGRADVTTDGIGSATVRFTTTNPAALTAGTTITATATAGATGDTSELSAAVAVVAVTPVGVLPATLPSGIQGTAYNQTLTATGGVGGPYAFAVTAGALPPGLTLSANGTLTGTPTEAGSFAFTVTATDSLGDVGGQNYTLSVAVPVPPPTRVHLLAVGAGPGGGPRVIVYNPDQSVRFDFFAYDPSLRGGVFVATGDLTGDGVDDIVTGPGSAEGGPDVRVFDGVSGNLVRSFLAYAPTFTGGVAVRRRRRDRGRHPGHRDRGRGRRRAERQSVRRPVGRASPQLLRLRFQFHRRRLGRRRRREWRRRGRHHHRGRGRRGTIRQSLRRCDRQCAGVVLRLRSRVCRRCIRRGRRSHRGRAGRRADRPGAGRRAARGRVRRSDRRAGLHGPVDPGRARRRGAGGGLGFRRRRHRVGGRSGRPGGTGPGGRRADPRGAGRLRVDPVRG